MFGPRFRFDAGPGQYMMAELLLAAGDAVGGVDLLAMRGEGVVAITDRLGVVLHMQFGLTSKQSTQPPPMIGRTMVQGGVRFFLDGDPASYHFALDALAGVQWQYFQAQCELGPCSPENVAGPVVTLGLSYAP